MSDSIETSPQRKDTIFELWFEENPILCHIEYPSGEIKGNLLLLHGWNFPALNWCENSSLCAKAKDSGFVLIIPFFGKSTYQWENYPETIESYKKYPHRKWMYEYFLPFLQSQELLKKDQNNFIAGLSTGGRGAALFALENPDIFNAGACLSADFDHSLLSDEPINNGFYGSINKHPERWKGKDNIHYRASEMEVPLYLGHGTNDVVCPSDQTKNYAEELSKYKKEFQLHLVPAKHDYDYWESETNAILSYFISFVK